MLIVFTQINDIHMLKFSMELVTNAQMDSNNEFCTQINEKCTIFFFF